jgi:Pyridoxamine 5'-phosphate oxidase
MTLTKRKGAVRRVQSESTGDHGLSGRAPHRGGGDGESAWYAAFDTERVPLRGEGLTFITRTDRLTYRHLQRDPRLSVCMDDPPVASDCAVISGTATCDDQDIWDEARGIMARDRAPDQVDDYLARWQPEPRVLITATPERISTRGTRRQSAAVKPEILSHDQASGHISLILHGEATAERYGVRHIGWEVMVHHVCVTGRVSMRRCQAGPLSPVAPAGRPPRPASAARQGPGVAAYPAIARS